jgi:hypothetical protein
MASRGDRIRFTILGEGPRDYIFAKAFLESALGKNKVECFRSQIVTGAGSGEQQVRELFPKELAAKRRRPKEERHWLVVVTDGDRFSPAQRRSQLEKETGRQDQAHPTKDEKVAVIVPCRNIESWFQWIDTGEIDEGTDYKRRFLNARPTKYAKLLSDKCQVLSADEFPPSLQDACEQWKKIAAN